MDRLVSVQPEGRLEVLARRVDELEAERDELRAAANNLLQVIRDMHKVECGINDELREKLIAANQSVETLMADYQSLGAQCAAVQDEADELRTRLKAAEEVIAAVNGYLTKHPSYTAQINAVQILRYKLDKYEGRNDDGHE